MRQNSFNLLKQVKSCERHQNEVTCFWFFSVLGAYTFIVNVAATTPSIMDSAKGSNRLSSLLIDSGFRTYPQRLLYSNIPRFNCMARSEMSTTKHYVLHMSDMTTRLGF